MPSIDHIEPMPKFSYMNTRMLAMMFDNATNFKVDKLSILMFDDDTNAKANWCRSLPLTELYKYGTGGFLEEAEYSLLISWF